MEVEQKITPIKSFKFENKDQLVTFTETLPITKGVFCDTFTFDGDKRKDLGIIRIDPGCKTPLQKVLKGDKTIEGYMLGKGRLIINRQGIKREIYNVGEKSQKPFSIIVNIGDLMQWEATKDSYLVAYEVCFPPYADGRYQNIK